MFLKASEICGRHVQASDGEVGDVDDLYVDDQRWGVRYLVVRTGGWLDARPVLLSPHSLRRASYGDDRLHVSLTREQVRNAPSIDTDKPVSRHHEAAHAGYYGYPFYWNGPLLWGGAVYPGVPPLAATGGVGAADDASAAEARRMEEQAAKESHLRSFKEIKGYTVRASDGDAGDVQDLLIDPASWGVRHLIVDTRPWWPGGLVAVAPESASRIDWGAQCIELALSRDAVKHASPQADLR